jgi:hypothetical protein
MPVHCQIHCQCEMFMGSTTKSGLAQQKTLKHNSDVWRKDAENVVRVQRYHYFAPCPTPVSPFLSGTDEDPADGQLHVVSAVLQELHTRYFSSGGQHAAAILKDMRSNILSGCHIVFSRVRCRVLAI